MSRESDRAGKQTFEIVMMRNSNSHGHNHQPSSQQVYASIHHTVLEMPCSPVLPHKVTHESPHLLLAVTLTLSSHPRGLQVPQPIRSMHADQATWLAVQLWDCLIRRRRVEVCQAGGVLPRLPPRAHAAQQHLPQGTHTHALLHVTRVMHACMHACASVARQQLPHRGPWCWGGMVPKNVPSPSLPLPIKESGSKQALHSLAHYHLHHLGALSMLMTPTP